MNNDFTGATEMFSNDSRSLLEDSRRNVEPGTSQVATDQRRYFTTFHIFTFLNPELLQTKDMS